MLPTRNANIILVYVLFLGIFAGWRPSHLFAQEAATAQDEKEGTSTCQVIRLPGNVLHDAASAYTYDGANRLSTVNGTGAAYTYFGPLRIKKVVG